MVLMTRDSKSATGPEIVERKEAGERHDYQRGSKSCPLWQQDGAGKRQAATDIILGEGDNVSAFRVRNPHAPNILLGFFG